VELKYARIELCDFAGYNDCYQLHSNDERFYIRFSSPSEGEEWSSLMTAQIEAIRAREASENQKLQMQVALITQHIHIDMDGLSKISSSLSHILH